MATKVHLRWLRIGIWARMDNNLIEVKFVGRETPCLTGKIIACSTACTFGCCWPPAAFWFGSAQVTCCCHSHKQSAVLPAICCVLNAARRNHTLMRILKDVSYFSSTCDRPATRGQAARSSSNQLRLCTDHETMVSVSRHVCCRASVSEIQGRTEKRSRALSRKNGSDGQRRSGQNCSSKVQRPRLQLFRRVPNTPPAPAELGAISSPLLALKLASRLL